MCAFFRPRLDLTRCLWALLQAYQFSLFFHELMYSSDRSSDPGSAAESNSGSVSAPDGRPSPPAGPVPAAAAAAAGPASAALAAAGPGCRAAPEAASGRRLSTGRHGALSVVAEALQRNGLPSPPAPPAQVLPPPEQALGSLSNATNHRARYGRSWCLAVI